MRVPDHGWSLSFDVMNKWQVYMRTYIFSGIEHQRFETRGYQKRTKTDLIVWLHPNYPSKEKDSLYIKMATFIDSLLNEKKIWTKLTEKNNNLFFYYRLSFCIPNTQKDAPTPEKELLFIFSPLCSFSLSFHLIPISS